jgi:hypothetical protein
LRLSRLSDQARRAPKAKARNRTLGRVSREMESATLSQERKDTLWKDWRFDLDR